MEDQPGEVVALAVPSGGWVSAEYHAGPGAFAVVWVHGFGSHRGGEKSAAVRSACAARGWPFLAFDFRGHGASPGAMPELTASRLLEDLGAVRTFLADRGHSRLGLVGSSMGGFAAAWFARHHPGAVVGCVLVAPAFGFLERRWNEVSAAERAAWQRTGRRRVVNEWLDVEIGYGLIAERDAFAPARLAAGWATPALIVHGSADTVVPDADSLDFYRAVSFPDVELRLLRSGDHRLLSYRDEIAAAAVRFFERLLGQ